MAPTDFTKENRLSYLWIGCLVICSRIFYLAGKEGGRAIM